MLRVEVGCIAALAGLFVACGKSSSSDEPARGGNAGSAGSSGTASGGASGTAPSGGEGGTAPSGGEGGAGASSGAAGAAGTGSGLVPYFEPGTRLKPMVLSAGPGLDLINGVAGAGWRDTELDFDCYFAIGPDGVERCNPRGLITSMTYSDATCTQPVLRTGPILPCGNESLRYVSRSAGDGCTGPAYHLGDQLPLSTPIFTDTNGGCEPDTATAPSDGILWRLEAVPPETFVAVHYVSRPREPGLDAYVREGDDGSWQVVAFSEPRRGPCADLTPVVTPPARCLPAWAIWPGGFGDAACLQRIAEIDPESCLPETASVIMHLDYDQNTCPLAQSVALWEIEGVRTSERYGPNDSETCSGPIDSVRAYLAGDPIDLATLPLIDHLEVGTEALRATFQGFNGVPYLPVSREAELFESASGERCYPREFADGARRCVPTSVPITVSGEFYYESPSCTGARVVVAPYRQPCLGDGPEPRAAVIAEIDEVCGTFTIVDTVAIAGASTAAMLYRTNPESGACVAFETTSGEPNAYLLGEALDPASTFSEVELVLRE